MQKKLFHVTRSESNVKISTTKENVLVTIEAEDLIFQLKFKDMDTLLGFSADLVEKGANTWPKHPMSIEYKA